MVVYRPKTTPRDYGFKSGDHHLVVNALTNTVKCFSSGGALIWEKPALPVGQRPEWQEYSGDTPPGVYRIGQVWDDHKRYAGRIPLNRTTRAYGWITFDLVDLEGNEDGSGRAGIAIHGGGSSLPDPLAPYQRLVPTLGCIRMHNADLLLIRDLLKTGNVYVSVTQDDK